MPLRSINGIALSYDEHGTGEPVVLVAGTGAPGRFWRTHQVPALTRAGFRAITIDNRGVPPSDVCEEGFTLDDMVGDTVGLIEALGIGPCRIVGFSMGAIVVQEVMVARPDLIRQAVLMATRGRTDPLSAAASQAELDRLDGGVKLPPRYEAVVSVMKGFSRRTLNDEQTVRDWLDVFEMSPISSSVSRSQLAVDLIPNRLDAYREVPVDCLVLGFEDDLMTPPHLCREVAAHFPRGTYQEIAGCGHYGQLEEPAAVNAAIIGFFQKGRG
ncbi:alpha/beta fold hydrolase [Actinomadura viridis]|uniref:Pimeloyl-ACP methyl ester carboxylesterase n=1 Tax=Actinomadura viridis TaxID=58110 RepID=A0A931DC70_9ACTN|nr:alpha/beta hydrolase [Actinomadura viridis]MBG6085903.1 pimeloyl-ACP methyl ester carboxylesterase [Actinomadura viridis]